MIEMTLTLDALVQTGATLTVGLLQCALILAGLRQMRLASAARDRQMDNQHAENMAALETLATGMQAAVKSLETVIERTGGSGTGREGTT